MLTAPSFAFHSHNQDKISTAVQGKFERLWLLSIRKANITTGVCLGT